MALGLLASGCGSDDYSTAASSDTTGGNPGGNPGGSLYPSPTNPGIIGPDGEPLPSVVAEGTVIDGYVQGATVCLDLTNDKDCGAAEANVTTTTDSNGRWALTIPVTDQNNTAIVAVAGAGATDTDGNVYDDGENRLVLAAPPGRYQNITPLTTYIYDAMVTEDMTEEEATNAVVSKMQGLYPGLNATNIYDDYIATGNSELTALAQSAANDELLTCNNSAKTIKIGLDRLDGNSTISATNIAISDVNESTTFNWKTLAAPADTTECGDNNFTAVIQHQGSLGTAVLTGDSITYTADSTAYGTDALVLSITGNRSGNSLLEKYDKRSVLVTLNGVKGKNASDNPGGHGGNTGGGPGGTIGSQGPGPIVRTLPTVTYTSPAAAATKIDTRSAIVAVFNVPMYDNTADKALFKVYDHATGTPVTCAPVVHSNTYTCQPSPALTLGGSYDVNISSGIHAYSGAQMSDAYSWNFTVETVYDMVGPDVNTTTPANDATGVSHGASVDIVFTEDLLPVTLNDRTIDFMDTSTNTEIPYTIAVQQPNTVRLTPTNGLNFSTKYSVTLTTDIENTAGMPMKKAYTFDFTTAAASSNDGGYTGPTLQIPSDPDITAPLTLRSVSPKEGNTTVDVDTAISAVFDHNMSDQSGITLKAVGGATVTGVPSASANTLIFTPDAKLATSTEYNATVTTNAQDIYGNDLNNSYSWTFTTASTDVAYKPEVNTTIPANGATNVYPQAIFVTFTEDMLANTINSTNIMLKQGGNTIPAGVVLSDTKTVQITPDTNLSYGTAYTVEITTAVENGAGNAMANPYSFGFTTVATPNCIPQASSFSDGPIGGKAATFDWLTKSGTTYTGGATAPQCKTFTASIKQQGTKGTSSISGNNMTYTPTYDHNGSDTVELTISNGFNESTDINVTIAGVDTTPVTVTGTSPLNGATGILLYSYIDINFSKPMDMSTITDTTLTLDGNDSKSKSCHKIENIGGAGNTVRCSPYVSLLSNELNANTKYTVKLDNNITDTDGNKIANSNPANQCVGSAYCFDFTTVTYGNSPFGLLRTGETTSYATYDDYWYVTNKGLGLPRVFTRDNTNNIVTDTVTGLQWEDDAAAASNSVSWANAPAACTALSLGGHTDWRLPTIQELTSILDYGVASNPMIFGGGNGFKNTAGGNTYYWSSSNGVISGANWGVYFSSGASGNYGRSGGGYVRCVRGGQTQSVGCSRYTRTGSIVTDTATGLQWEDDATAENFIPSWATALTTCENLSLGGYTDWRLPNVNELGTVVDIDAAAAPFICPAFQHRVSNYYWSSSTYAPNTSNAWYVNFSSGNNLAAIGKTVTGYMRCVRGGQ